MWLHVNVLVTAQAGVSLMTVLNTFATYEDCQPERDRVGFEMAESYPEENTFRIECALQEQKPALQPIRFERARPHPVTQVADPLRDPSSQLSLSHQRN